MRISSASAIGLGLLAGCTDPVVANVAHVRVAHLSPDAPAVDFCLAEHGSKAFIGPVLAGAGAPGGVAYGNVTRYLDVRATQYDVRLVAPGSSVCDSSLGLPDFTQLPELPTEGSVTLAAIGLVADKPGFDLRAFVDDTDVAFGKAKLRFIHASPGAPDVDVGLGGGVVFTPVFTDVAFGATDGYVETSPLMHKELSARAHGALSDLVEVKPAVLPAGNIATAFAIGIPGNPHAPLGVLLCLDNAAPAGALTDCKIVSDIPARGHVRIAHLSPDAPAVDVCIANPDTGAYTDPLFRALGVPNGLAYPQVTTYVDLPIGTYSVRVVAATAGSCATPVVADTAGLAIAKDLTATVAAIGDLDPSGHAANDPAFRLAVFGDDTAVTAMKTKLRFVHASPGTPAVDVGLGSGGAFTRVFANIAFGNIAVGTAFGANGFVETMPYAGPVSARLANQATDALTIPHLALEADAITTAFAIGNKTGSHTNPLQVLLCTDNAAPNGLLARCTVAP